MVKENGMVMMSENEYTALIEKSEKETKKLRKMLINLIHSTKANKTGDTKLKRTEFYNLYNFAVNEMFNNFDDGNENEDENAIYGHDLTIHWHGFYCNCLDGAAVSNHILPGIKGLIDEYDDEEWGNE